jgi:phage terminase small subunit
MSKVPTGKTKKTTREKLRIQADARVRMFIQHYLKTYNATQAALDAKYAPKSAHVQGCRLLKNDKVQAAIAAAEHLIENKTLVSKDKIMKEMSLIGFSNVEEHLTVDDGGTVRALSFDELPLGASRAIKKIKEKRIIKSVQGTKDKPSEDVILESTFEFELYDKITALVNMGKELGMFRDRQEHTGKDGVPLEVTLRVIYDEKPQKNGD